MSKFTGRIRALGGWIKHNAVGVAIVFLVLAGGISAVTTSISAVGTSKEAEARTADVEQVLAKVRAKAKQGRHNIIQSQRDACEKGDSLRVADYENHRLDALSREAAAENLGSSGGTVAAIAEKNRAQMRLLRQAYADVHDPHGDSPVSVDCAKQYPFEK